MLKVMAIFTQNLKLKNNLYDKLSRKKGAGI